MATYQLLVNGTNVLPAGADVTAPNPPVSLISFERNYDEPASLVIQAHGDWRLPPYAPDSVVVLLRDGVAVFRGLLDLPRPIASEVEYPRVEYTAFDDSRLLRFPSAVDSQGDPVIELDPGDVSTVIAQYLTHVGQSMSDRGIDKTVKFTGGAGAIETLPITFDNESIDAGFRRIAATGPGVRAVILPNSDGSQSQYAICNIFNSPTFDLELDRERISELSIQQSIDGRAGAVRTLSGRTTGSADVELDQNESLVPVWDPADESIWEWSNAFTLDTNAQPTALAEVYRKFSFAAFADKIDASTPMVGLLKTVEDIVNPRFQKVAVKSIDLSNKTLLLEYPAIKQLGIFKAGNFDPFDPGLVRPITDVRLFFRQSGPASTPIFIDSVRVPATGFAGQAYELAPKTMGYEKIITVPEGVNIQAYAEDVHRALSKPTISGVIPLNEDLPADLWFLDRRLNILTISHGLTGYEGLGAPVLGVSVNFLGGVTSSILFNRDESQLLAGDVQ